MFRLKVPSLGSLSATNFRSPKHNPDAVRCHNFKWCILLVFKNMECNKMHFMRNIKFTDVQQAKSACKFKNTKENFVGPKQLFEEVTANRT
jgi:hypothetical protein